MESMLSDYKVGSTDKAVNIIPYYNYYMYSPIRTDSNITADDIKNFLFVLSSSSSKNLRILGKYLKKSPPQPSPVKVGFKFSSLCYSHE